MPPKRTQRAAAAKALVAMKEESTDHSDHSEDEQLVEDSRIRVLSVLELEQLFTEMAPDRSGEFRLILRVQRRYMKCNSRIVMSNEKYLHCSKIRSSEDLFLELILLIWQPLHNSDHLEFAS